METKQGAAAIHGERDETPNPARHRRSGEGEAPAEPERRSVDGSAEASPSPGHAPADPKATPKQAALTRPGAAELAGWCPFEDRRPETDDDYFEALTAAVFQARFRPEVIRARWDAIREAFAGFDLRRVASWPDSDLERLMAYPQVIHNEKKIRATLRNARDLLERAEEHGSVRAYLESFGGDTDALVADLDTWAHYIGAPSIRWFVRCAMGGR